MRKAFSTLLRCSLRAGIVLAAAASVEEGESSGRRSLIIGGTQTTNLEFPFYVQSKGLVCGGSLVAKDVVATAAHCAGEFHGDVLVGAWLRNKTLGTSAQWRKTLSRMVIHPRYNFSNDRNDYMLFKIEPVTVPGLTPIRLNTDPTVPRLGDQFLCIGMGFNSTNYTFGDRLLKVPVKYVQPDFCQDQWALDDNYYYYNETKVVYDESMFCAIGDTVETKGPAPGDSGGPVFNAAANLLVGIVSWGGPYPDKTATPFFPSVFSRVSFAADWMKETICKLTSDPGSLSCPNFRCPFDEQILGFPQAVIPNRTSFVQSSVPLKNVVQRPAPGTLVNSNSVTRVTITATNANTNAMLSCSFDVTVGPVEFLGGTIFAVNASNVRTRRANPYATDFPRSMGYIHRVVLEVVDAKLLGSGAKMSTQIMIGNRWSKPVTLVAGQSNKSMTFAPKLFFGDTLTMKIGLNSTNVALPTSTKKYDVNVYVYGQKMY